MLLQMVDLRATINILSAAVNVIKTSVQNVESDVDVIQRNLEFDRQSNFDLVENAAVHAGNSILPFLELWVTS